MSSTEPQLVTEPYLDDVRLRPLWPPQPNALCKLLMALLPRSALEREDSPWVNLLPLEDWYVDNPNSMPCLILGRVVMRPNGKYYPEESYSLANILKLTREYRQPQKEQEKRRQEQEAKQLEQQRQKAAREQHWRQQEERHRQEVQNRIKAQQMADTRKELEHLKQRLAQLEQQTNPTRE